MQKDVSPELRKLAYRGVQRNAQKLKDLLEKGLLDGETLTMTQKRELERVTLYLDSVNRQAKALENKEESIVDNEGVST